MARILVLEDDAIKAADVVRELEAAGARRSDIEVVPDVVGAKRRLRADRIDLWIADLNVPVRWSSASQMTGGADIIEGILGRPDWYGVPQHIIALTAYDEIANALDERLGASGVVVFRYRPDATGAWRPFVRALVRRMAPVATPEADVAIFTTTDLETEAFRMVFPELVEADPGLGVACWSGALTGEGGPVALVAARSPQMGMPAAAVTVSSILELYRPRVALMGGVCAGVRDRAGLGDLVLADPCWDYGSGKVVRGGRLVPDPRPERVQPRIRAMVERAVTSTFLQAFHSGRLAKPRAAPQLLVAPAVSGSSVVSDPAVLDSVAEHARKVTALDMEAYGFLHACARASGGRGVPGVSLKSVSDFADASKSDDHQAFCAELSFRALREVALCPGIGLRGDEDPPE